MNAQTTIQADGRFAPVSLNCYLRGPIESLNTFAATHDITFRCGDIDTIRFIKNARQQSNRRIPWPSNPSLRVGESQRMNPSEHACDARGECNSRIDLAEYSEPFINGGSRIAGALAESPGSKILLPIPAGGKEQRSERWQQLILSDVTPDNFAHFNDDNTEISLRAVSERLCTADVHNRDVSDAFLQGHPQLNKCHMSSGKPSALVADARNLLGRTQSIMKSGTPREKKHP